MPTLTLQAIRENPWNVVAHTLPEQADRLLLGAAYFAAEYGRSSETIFVMAMAAGYYKARGWEETDDAPDEFLESEARSIAAHLKFNEICDRYEAEYGESLRAMTAAKGTSSA